MPVAVEACSLTVSDCGILVEIVNQVFLGFKPASGGYLSCIERESGSLSFDLSASLFSSSPFPSSVSEMSLLMSSVESASRSFVLKFFMLLEGSRYKVRAVRVTRRKISGSLIRRYRVYV